MAVEKLIAPQSLTHETSGHLPQSDPVCPPVSQQLSFLSSSLVDPLLQTHSSAEGFASCFTEEEKHLEENFHRLSPSAFLPTCPEHRYPAHRGVGPLLYSKSSSCHCPWGHRPSHCPCPVPAAASSMDPTVIRSMPSNIDTSAGSPRMPPPHPSSYHPLATCL